MITFNFYFSSYTGSQLHQFCKASVYAYCLLMVSFSSASAQQDSVMDEAGEADYIYDPDYQKVVAEKAPFQIREDEQGLKGVYNLRKKDWSIAPIYDHIGWSPSFGRWTPAEFKSDRNYVIASKDGLKGVFHKDGTPIFPVQFLRTINADSLTKRGNLWILKNQEKR